MATETIKGAEATFKGLVIFVFLVFVIKLTFMARGNKKCAWNTFAL